MPSSAAKPLRLLYLTACEPASGDNIIAPTSRIAVGMLSRDFHVSLAVAGPIDTVGMNRLRVDLGPVRVAGGLEPSSADRRAAGGLRSYLRERYGSDLINARLQAAVQRKADDFEAVIIDDIAAWPYRPVMSTGPLAYLAREVTSADEQPRKGLWASLRHSSLREFELSIFDDIDYLFAKPDVADLLSEIGVPMRVLQDNYSRPGSGRPTFDDAVFSLTGDRIGYAGYLGAEKNIASLDWFLQGVWPLLRSLRPEVELHVVGSAASDELKQRLTAIEGVYVHWGGSDRKLLDLGCRVVVDPLLYEDHVDSKLVNAMTRSIPVVTTVAAVNRAHSGLGGGVVAAGSPEEMAELANDLMTRSTHWKAVSDRARAVAAELLPDFEVAHAMRRVFTRSGRE
jgi:hypothetical protein